MPKQNMIFVQNNYKLVKSQQAILARSGQVNQPAANKFPTDGWEINF